jgi:hypothetical protein
MPTGRSQSSAVARDTSREAWRRAGRYLLTATGTAAGLILLRARASDEVPGVDESVRSWMLGHSGRALTLATDVSTACWMSTG